MEFILTGFRQEENIRQFTFEGMGADRKKTQFTVGADLVLVRKYQIAMQDLPLLCRRRLEQRVDGDEARTVMFAEDDMRSYARIRADARELAVQSRKAPRRPHSTNSGAAWRGMARPAT